MKLRFNKRLLLVGILIMLANFCFSQVIRQEGDEFLEKKLL